MIGAPFYKTAVFMVSDANAFDDVKYLLFIPNNNTLKFDGSKSQFPICFYLTKLKPLKGHTRGWGKLVKPYQKCLQLLNLSGSKCP
jgi:hypothetical protein